MESASLEEILDNLKEGIESEVASEGIAAWSINASGLNLADYISNFSLNELKDLRDEIVEGSRIEITFDLSDAILAHVEDLIEEGEDEAIAALDNDTDDEEEEEDSDEEKWEADEE